MDTRVHINIGREIGAGGLSIANILGERLGIEVFDKKLISLAAGQSGIDEKLFARADESNFMQLSNNFGVGISEAVGHTFGANFISGVRLFKIQGAVIKRLAEERSTIFVGRCADYILRDTPNCFNVFITADINERIERVRERKLFPNSDTMSDKRVKELIRRADSKRRNYYENCTLKTWGAASSYDLCINSSLFGIEKTALIIEDYVRRLLPV